MGEYFRTAIASIWSNKVRSLLNILGVVIGVSSVTILIALGEGLKQDVSNMIQDFGTNVIVVTGGKLDDSGQFGQGGSNPANFISGDVLTMTDVQSIEHMTEIESVTPMGLVSGNLKYQDKTAVPSLVGVYSNFLESFEALSLDKGQMFEGRSADRVIVLGPDAAKALFGDSDPVGKNVALGEAELEVIGVLKSAAGPSVFGDQFSGLSLIPFDTATELNKGQEKIMRIYGKAQADADVAAVKKEIERTLESNHGEDDFTVMTQDDMLSFFNTFLDLATTMVSAIAAVSLVVGGIGIMNIMLVTVTERTREIGLRKAVGATKLAILWQFLIEAVVITFLGSLIGLLLAFVAAAIVALQTELQPAITLSTIGLAVGISVVVGVVFGLWPATRAAQKDPIEALRYE